MRALVRLFGLVGLVGLFGLAACSHAPSAAEPRQAEWRNSPAGIAASAETVERLRGQIRTNMNK